MEWRWGGGSDYCDGCKRLTSPPPCCAAKGPVLCPDRKLPKTDLGRRLLRIVAAAGCWRTDSWAGTVRLDYAGAWTLIDRLIPGADPEMVSAHLAAIERGAIAGVARLKAQRKAP